jgi:hypothetical protein
MSNWPDAVLLAEGGFTLIFCLLLVSLRKRMGTADSFLWSLVWLTRVLSSLSGSRNLLGAPTPDLTRYIGMQGCAAVALTIIVVRGETRVMRERTLRGIWAQIVGLYTGPREEDSRGRTQEASGGQDSEHVPPYVEKEG